MSHSWDNWDVGGVADAIEAYWRSDRDEAGHRVRLAEMVAPYLQPPGLKILEVGCGSGLIYERLRPLLSASSKYVGVDTSKKMLRIAQRNFPRGTFVENDAYDLSFDDDSFDVVFCFEVLGHVPHIDRIVKELLRVAQKTCVMTIWPSSEPHIVEGYELVEASQFLHRQYPDAYMRRIIASARGNPRDQIDVVKMTNNVWAYVVTLDQQAAMGVG